MTKILACKCKHKFQDSEHDGKRVHNRCNSGWRCTVCGDIKDAKRSLGLDSD